MYFLHTLLCHRNSKKRRTVTQKKTRERNALSLKHDFSNLFVQLLSRSLPLFRVFRLNKIKRFSIFFVFFWGRFLRLLFFIFFLIFIFGFGLLQFSILLKLGLLFYWLFCLLIFAFTKFLSWFLLFLFLFLLLGLLFLLFRLRFLLFLMFAMLYFKLNFRCWHLICKLVMLSIN